MKMIIGNATVYLGDAYTLLPTIGAVDAMVTDPPYKFSTSGGGKHRKKRTLMERIDAMDIANGFDCSIFKSDLYGSVMTFCHNNQLLEIGSRLAAEYPRTVLCGWKKTNPTPFANKNYKPDLEPYIHAWRKGFHPQGDPIDLSHIIETPVIKSPYDHPTVKPDKVMNKIMNNVAGETVIDPFAGTGSTGVAAIRYGKKFIGIERDPKAFNIMCGRLFELNACFEVF